MPSNVVVHARQHGECLACCCCGVIDKCVVFLLLYFGCCCCWWWWSLVYSVVQLVVVLCCRCWCCTTSSGRVVCKYWFQLWWCICTVSAICRQTWWFTHGSTGECVAYCCCGVIDKCVVFYLVAFWLVLLLVVGVYSGVHLVVVLCSRCWCCTTSSGRVGCKY